MLPVLGVISSPTGEDEGAGEGENGEAKTTLQLDVLKLFAEMSSFCGELDKSEHYTQIVFNTLLVGGASSHVFVFYFGNLLFVVICILSLSIYEQFFVGTVIVLSFEILL